jgi:phosphomannomutase
MNYNCNLPPICANLESASKEMLETLALLRTKCTIGFVGGSDLVKQQEQLGDAHGVSVLDMFDYCFAENGLTAYRLGKQLPSQSFINWIGEDKYKRLVNFILHYIADLDIPIKRYYIYVFRNTLTRGAHLLSSERE